MLVVKKYECKLILVRVHMIWFDLICIYEVSPQAPGEEEKARMLLGSSSMPGGVKPGKRFLSFRN